MTLTGPRVVGLDLSLTSTGVSDGQSTRVIQTAPGPALEARLDTLLRSVVAFVLSPTQWTDRQPYGMRADLVVIEAPAWSRAKQTGHEELSALRVMVRHRLWRLDIPYALVPPTTLKKYTTGNGTASKQLMVFTMDDRYGAGLSNVLVKDGRYDRADALALAAMGYDHVGHPLKQVWSTSMPPCRDSLDGVRWPPLLSDEN